MRLLVLAVSLTACISIPPFRGDTDGGADSTHDANVGPLAVRWIANAYREGGADGAANGSLMMSKGGYSIATTGIVDGDLVLLVGNVDNGTNGFWVLPSGFQLLTENFYGQDGQTYVVAWKIAAGEPARYNGTYLSDMSTSGASTVSLVAVSGYDPVSPFEDYKAIDHQVPTNPADIGNPGLTTTTANTLLLFAAGADWTPNDGANTYQPPADFQLVTSIGDRQTHWDWTCQVISYKVQPTAGATGALTATLTAKNFSDNTTPIPGGGWSALIAIAPHS